HERVTCRLQFDKHFGELAMVKRHNDGAICRAVRKLAQHLEVETKLTVGVVHLRVQPALCSHLLRATHNPNDVRPGKIRDDNLNSACGGMRRRHEETLPWSALEQALIDQRRDPSAHRVTSDAPLLRKRELGPHHFPWRKLAGLNSVPELCN